MLRQFISCGLLALVSVACLSNWLSAQTTKQQTLSVEKTDSTLTVTQAGKPVLVYNIQSPKAPKGIDAVYERSGFLHPVSTPSGQVVTAAFPVDHAHQHGIFSAWVKTTYAGKAVDFWNLGGRTGRVVHEKIGEPMMAPGGSVQINIDLLHRVVLEPQTDVLREHWKLTVLPTDGSYHMFDLETRQEAITDEPLVIEEYHYGGVAVRGPVKWLLKNDGWVKDKSKAGESLAIEESSMLDDQGHDRLAGNHAHSRWVALTGLIEGKPAGIVMLSHPDNFRAPQAARLHPTKPYFCYAPCVDGKFVIDKQHPYVARYRFLVIDTPADAKWIDQRWQEWAK